MEKKLFLRIAQIFSFILATSFLYHSCLIPCIEGTAGPIEKNGALTLLIIILLTVISFICSVNKNIDIKKYIIIIGSLFAFNSEAQEIEVQKEKEKAEYSLGGMIIYEGARENRKIHDDLLLSFIFMREGKIDTEVVGINPKGNLEFTLDLKVTNNLMFSTFLSQRIPSKIENHKQKNPNFISFGLVENIGKYFFVFGEIRKHLDERKEVYPVFGIGFTPRVFLKKKTKKL